MTIQLKWVTQAQFAGYYVAKDKGFYKEAGLDVTIKPGGPDIAPPQVIAGGGADVIVDWMPSALAAREKGVPLVNIAQPFKKSGMMLDLPRRDRHQDSRRTSRAGPSASGSPATSIRSSPGWRSSAYKTDGSAGGVKVLKQGFNVDPLIQKQADCISTMTYNEYWQVIDAGFKPEQLVVFKYEDQGVATLEDGLYVMQDKLKDPAFVAKMAKFVAASQKGWDYARQNPDEAAKIVLDNDASGAQTEKHQKRMMGEIAKLLDTRQGQARSGRLRPHRRDPAVPPAATRPVITKKPEGAWSHAVVDATRCKSSHRRSSPRRSGEERPTPFHANQERIKGDPSWPSSSAAEPS